MTPEEITMHLAAGRYYGQQATCGNKVASSSEEKANRQIEEMIRKNHPLEAYPCYWCTPSSEKAAGRYQWHVGREMSPAEREIFLAEGDQLLAMETINVKDESDPLYGINGLRVHSRKLCEGRNCCIHNPSETVMKTWPLSWRPLKRTMERTCHCGVGHTDVDDIMYRTSISDVQEVNSVHGCCPKMCCEEAYDEMRFILGG